jgi:peptidoglycan hydrolase-like protein with peptidoglycan-binding domain
VPKHSPSIEELSKGLVLPTGARHIVTVPTTFKVRLLEVSPRFAPGKEIFENGDLAHSAPGEKCTIKYEIDDPFGRITEARLEVARKAKAGTPIAILPLSPGAYQPGEHSYDWDGLCSEGAMAGQYLHALHSPYVFKLIAKRGAKVVEDSGKETSVVLAGIALARGRYFSEAGPPAEGSDAYYQYALTALGFHCGPIDGSLGKKSECAIKSFQRAYSGLKATGTLDVYTKAYLDAKAPPGTGVDHYQFILSSLGYRCGAIDGLVGKRTKRAVTRYRVDKGVPPGDALDDDVKAALDGEAIPAPVRRETLEDDLKVAEPHENPLPTLGKEKKIFIDCDSALSPSPVPYQKKAATEQSRLVRPHFPVLGRPLLRTRDGKLAFSPVAVGPVRLDFTVSTAAPPADLGIPSVPARTFVQGVMTKDGGEASTGHHAHKNRGGVRTSSEPGVFLAGKGLDPYQVSLDGNKHLSKCIDKFGDAARGSAGVYFVPSTIAGDRFGLVATVNSEGFDTPPPAPITAETGTLIVWRRYRVGKLWLLGYVPRPHRTETQRQLGLPAWYESAFITFVEPRADADVKPLMVEPRAADKRQVDLALFTAILREAGYRSSALSDAQIQSRFGAKILWPLPPVAVYHAANEQAYYQAVSSEIDAYEARLATTLHELSQLEDYEGLTLLVFDRNAPRAGQLGVHAITNPQFQSWGWSVLASQATVLLIHNQDTTANAVANGAVDGETLAHEFGHGLWLHHATTQAGQSPDPADQPEHNAPEWQTCTMSYIALPNFCGRCNLKLRGWDETKL